MGPHTWRIKEVFVDVNSYEHSMVGLGLQIAFASLFYGNKRLVMAVAELSSRTSTEQGCEGSQIKLCVVSITRWKSL